MSSDSGEILSLSIFILLKTWVNLLQLKSIFNSPYIKRTMHTVNVDFCLFARISNFPYLTKLYSAFKCMTKQVSTYTRASRFEYCLYFFFFVRSNQCNRHILSCSNRISSVRKERYSLNFSSNQ